VNLCLGIERIHSTKESAYIVLLLPLDLIFLNKTLVPLDFAYFTMGAFLRDSLFFGHQHSLRRGRDTIKVCRLISSVCVSGWIVGWMGERERESK